MIPKREFYFCPLSFHAAKQQDSWPGSLGEQDHFSNQLLIETPRPISSVSLHQSHRAHATLDTPALALIATDSHVAIDIVSTSYIQRRRTAMKNMETTTG